MSDHVVPIARAQAPPCSWRAAMPPLIATGFYLLLLLLAGKMLSDADIYWHVRVGEWIAEHRAFPQTDLFSATFAGAPWIAKEWLSQLTFAAAYHAAGWAGVAIVAAVAVAATFWIFARVLLHKLDPVPTLVLVLAAIALTAPHILARPHVLALPVTVLWTVGLVRALDERRAPSLWLLPLMTLWANLHGGFTFGILLIGACALEASVTDKTERWAAARHWGVFGMLAIVAACITPYGPTSIMMTGRILGLGEALALLIEWQPQNFSNIGPFELCLLGAIGFVLYRGITLPLLRILIVLGLLHMSLAHARNDELLVLLAPLFIAAPLRDQIGQEQPIDGPLPRRLIACLTLLAGIASGALLRTHTLTPAYYATPSAALDALTRAKAGPILNDYGFGGYMIQAGVPPFIDGRAELYGGPFIARHHHAVTLANLPDFLRLLDEYKIGATLLAPDRPAVALLDRLPDWQRLYSDDVAVAHIRRVGQ
jgi:hypothetical protein